jgi:hypothetical protein
MATGNIRGGYIQVTSKRENVYNIALSAYL